MKNVRLADAARDDIGRLLTTTLHDVGTVARQRYATLVTTALRSLARDPTGRGNAPRPAGRGNAPRPELGSDVRVYHLRHARDCGPAAEARVKHPRHLLVYRHHPSHGIEVIRVLHDAMDLQRPLSAGVDEDNGTSAQATE